MSNAIKRFMRGGVWLLLALGTLEAAPQRYYDQDSTTAIREMRDSIDAIRHEVSNHETEIRMCQERAENQEATIASLRQQVLDTNQTNKELVKGNIASLESKFANMDSTNKGLIADLTQLRSHANESASVLAQYKQKIAELERIIDQQNQNIDNLQTALRSLTDAFGSTLKSSDSTSSKVYKVKNGDSLEKIAKANNTTVKAIKELNGLQSDRINVGQTLQLP